jgi:electron transfer flavoprotein beta subunit
MKIYVCIKHVPDTGADIKVLNGIGFDESVKFVMNPYDEYALEEAVRLAENNGGEVIVVSVGKPSTIKTIRKALACGGDRGLLVKTDTQFMDSATTAMVLKKVINMDGTPGIIFTGKQSVDTEGMQTQYRLAAAFDMPVANEVVSFSLKSDRAVVEYEIGSGDREVAELCLPCVIAATKGLNEPRYPSLPDIMKANKKEVKEFDLAELDIELPVAFSELTALASVSERRRAEILKGSVRDMAEELVRRLKTEAKVL